MGGYLFRGGLLGIALGWSFQEGGRQGMAFHGHVGDIDASE